MKKTYVLITLASVLIISIIAFTLNSTPNPTTANNKEVIKTTQAEIGFDNNNFKKIVFIKEEQGFRFYLFEDEIQKTLTSQEYLESKNWKMRVFGEPLDEKEKSMFEQTIKELVQEKNDVKLDLWSIAFDLEYDNENQIVNAYARYMYNSKGTVIFGPHKTDWNTPIVITSVNKDDPKKDFLFSILSQYTNEYLTKELKESKNKFDS